MDRATREARKMRKTGTLLVSALTVLSFMIMPTSAGASGAGDTIYWGNESGPVRSGNLGGGGATDVFVGETPCGLAIDPAAGKLYWASWGSGLIRVGNLDGPPAASTLFNEGGNNLCGVAVDPGANKIYWANFSTNTIWSGNLNGSGATLLFQEPGTSAPSGVAIDPVAGKIYWTNQFTDQVRVGNLNGTGTASTLFGTGVSLAVERNPIGVAIDPAAGKIYWTNLGNCCSGPGKVRVGNLDGTGSPSTLFDNENGPGGLAIDPGANKIYWATFGPGVIRSGNLDGTGASDLFTGQSSSLFTALLKTPAGTGVPAVSSAGGELSCSQGSWAPDLLGAFLYRAPESFAYQWLLDGNEIGGALDSTYTPAVPGDYTCRVTASNHAGPASQTSAPWVIYDWSGFFAPVDNRDGAGDLIFNKMKAGAAVPVKFRLNGNQGLNIFAAGYPKSVPIACDSTAEIDGIEETVNAGQSSLSYDPVTDTYTYVWKTLKAWGVPASCRQLVIELNDGTFHRANFRFVK